MSITSGSCPLLGASSKARLGQLYRPQPVRLVEIPKEDGSLRRLGIRCPEDNIVQELTHRILEAIHKPVLIETSYGFRPKRNCHDALRQLDREMVMNPVNWVADRRC